MDEHDTGVMNPLGPTEIGAPEETTVPLCDRSMSDGGSLRIYLSGSRNRRSEIALCSDSLKSSGHLHVISEWHERRDDPDGAALRDYHLLKGADVVVVFSGVSASEDLQPHRHLELGMAVGMDKPCVLIGPVEHNVHMMPHTKWVLPNWTPHLVDILLDVAFNGLSMNGTFHGRSSGKTTS